MADDIPASASPATVGGGNLTTAEATTISVSSRSAEEYYRANDCTVVSLAVLCVGMKKEDGSPLLDVAAKPWNEYVAKKGVRSIQPTTPMLKAEIHRRWSTFYSAKAAADAALIGGKAEKPPKYKNWGQDKLVEWLNTHPIAIESEIIFLRTAIEVREQTANEASNAKAVEANKLKNTVKPAAKKSEDGNGMPWKGRDPFLRLIHALFDFCKNKEAYIKRGSLPPGRMTIEQRNTAYAKKNNVFQMIADTYMDRDFSPATDSAPELDQIFSVSKTITYDSISHYLACNASNVEARINAMLNILKRNIPKWEKSGQGEGGRKGDDNDDVVLVDDGDDDDDDDADDDVIVDIQVDDVDDDNSVDSEDSLSSSKLRESVQGEEKKQTSHRFGSTDGRSTYALASRTEFFRKNEKHALYFWHMLNKHNLFGNAMSMLRDGVGSLDGADGIPSAINKNTEHDSDIEDNMSIGSKSRSSRGSSIKSKSSLTSGDGVSSSIHDYGNKMIQFANMRAAQKMKEHELTEKSKEKDRYNENMREKRQKIERIDDKISALKAEKRSLGIRLYSQDCMSNTPLQNHLQSSINDVDAEIEKHEKEISELSAVTEDCPTPVKTNRSP